MCTSKAGFGIQDSRSAEAPNARHPAFSILNPQKGISLIELIMFIVIVSVSLAGILLVMNTITRGSADPLVHKQALAIAESLLEEVELMPFTFCDPDDPTATSAMSAVVGAGACTVQVENLGSEAAFAPYQATDETRYSVTTPFDNVSDYDGFNMAAGAILDITGVVIGPTGYAANITVTPAALGVVPAGEALLITVTVTGPDNVPITLESYRTRYAPRAVP
jgi:MSHA pilin protein MshD